MSILARLRALPRTAWILFIGTFLNKFGSFVIPFLALYMTRRGFSIDEAGLGISAYGMGLFAASGLGGYLADRIGRRRTIVLSMFSAAGAMLLLSQAERLPEIIALTFLTGLTAELYRPAASALLTDLVPVEQRVTAFGAYRLALNAGWAFGPATAGFLAEHSFLWLFVGDAITSVAFGLVAWLALPGETRSHERQGGVMQVLKMVRRDGAFLRYLAATGASALVFYQMSSTFGLQVQHLGYSNKVYGALISFNGVLIVLLELPLTLLTQRFPARRTMALGYLLVGGGYAYNAWSESIPALVMVMVLYTFGEMISMPVAAAYAANLAPPDFRGRYQGVSGLVWALGLVFGPALGLYAFARNPNFLWVASGLLGLLAAIIILSGREDRAGP